MTDERQVNMHGDHAAACVCCKNFDVGYEDDLSDVTPGRGFYCECSMGHFDLLDSMEYHELVVFAIHCDDFLSIPLKETKK